ncbi:ATP-binding protein [Chitinophaga sp. CB10]|uniref:sensor histidine kinase n=1 Tax=Chitinophaga sp. CB10 TaxID=1891659 RepID=UPI0025BCFE89|nr:ATP-binding protein [Chitinophaga sp. CB10]
MEADRSKQKIAVMSPIENLAQPSLEFSEPAAEAYEQAKQLDAAATERRYQKMIDEVEDYAILMLSVNGIILNWNKGAQKIKGYTEEEIVGNHFRIFYPKEDQLRQLPEKLIGVAAEQGKAIHEGWRVRKDGTTFWGSAVITAMHDTDGSIIGFSKVTRDLTERKLAEQQILKYTQQLESQNMELQKFAFAAAHDMKEPLRKIQLYNRMVLEAEDLQLSDRQKDYLLRSADAARRMQGLIDDMLAFTKISEQTIVFESVSLQEVVDELTVFFAETLEQTGGKIIANNLPSINGIAFQLRQLFENLIGNSLKYHRKGVPPEIVITAGVEPILNQSTGREDNVMVLTVADNGIGFDQHYAMKIFEMFERLHTRDEFPGTGIGLAICRKIVENHRGTIQAISKPGEGAVFSIYLPA